MRPRRSVTQSRIARCGSCRVAGLRRWRWRSRRRSVPYASRQSVRGGRCCKTTLSDGVGARDQGGRVGVALAGSARSSRNSGGRPRRPRPVFRVWRLEAAAVRPIRATGRRGRRPAARRRRRGAGMPLRQWPPRTQAAKPRGRGPPRRALLRAQFQYDRALACAVPDHTSCSQTVRAAAAAAGAATEGFTIRALARSAAGAERGEGRERRAGAASALPDPRFSIRDFRSAILEECPECLPG